jgi:5,10-methylenetetrahydromethanopterin reductase
MTTPRVGMCFDRTFPAPAVTEFAEHLERDGVDELWIIEDCFSTAGISLAATALARTDRLTVGLGILPAVARTAAITAMEIATLAALAPGRLIAGIGHGVQEWMAQMGARTPSPVSTLEETIVAVRQLLRGEEVSTSGRHVFLDKVRLDAPPSIVPPVLAGVRGPKSLAMAGRVADGLVLAEGTGPMALRAAIAEAGSPPDFNVTVFGALSIMPSQADARGVMTPFLAGLIEARVPGLTALPYFDEMAALVANDGPSGLMKMPTDWWHQIGPIGTLDDAVAHVAALGDAGARSVALFPAPILDVARFQRNDVAAIAAALK